MARAAVLLFLLFCSACERVNPSYCDEFAPCMPGTICTLPAHRCVPAFAVDLGQAADGVARAVPPDLATPPDLRPSGHPDISAAIDLAMAELPPSACIPACGTGSGTYCDEDSKMCAPCDTASHCGATTCFVCSDSSSSGQPSCKGTKCVCKGDKDCGPGAHCITETCYRECSTDMDCKSAPQGSACALGFPFQHCMCNDDTQCPVPNTRCDTLIGICRCGGTVCRDGQRCEDGMCID